MALILVALALIYVIFAMVLTKYAIHQSQEPPQIKVVNRSRTDLQDVMLEGSGFSEPLGLITAGESRWVTVHPPGESGVYISFVADGERYRSDYESYFEGSGGYKVIVIINQDLSVNTRYGSFLLP
ncbi:MAG: hypothetical protein PVH92_07665 [Anaerolineales bacterium]